MIDNQTRLARQKSPASVPLLLSRAPTGLYLTGSQWNCLLCEKRVIFGKHLSSEARGYTARGLQERHDRAVPTRVPHRKMTVLSGDRESPRATRPESVDVNILRFVVLRYRPELSDTLRDR